MMLILTWMEDTARRNLCLNGTILHPPPSFMGHGLPGGLPRSLSAAPLRASDT